jgi:hypothetical protein
MNFLRLCSYQRTYVRISEHNSIKSVGFFMPVWRDEGYSYPKEMVELPHGIIHHPRTSIPYRLLHFCASHLRIPVQAAHRIIHSCLSSPDIRPDCTLRITSSTPVLSSPDIRSHCTTHITSHSLMPFISMYPFTPHRVSHHSHRCLHLQISVHPA